MSMSANRNLLLVAIPIGIIVFVVLLVFPSAIEDKQALTLSKESCESFGGFWYEEKFECGKITLEQCTRMGRTFVESNEPTWMLEPVMIYK